MLEIDIFNEIVDKISEFIRKYDDRPDILFINQEALKKLKNNDLLFKDNSDNSLKILGLEVKVIPNLKELIVSSKNLRYRGIRSMVLYTDEEYLLFIKKHGRLIKDEIKNEAIFCIRLPYVKKENPGERETYINSETFCFTKSLDEFKEVNEFYAEVLEFIRNSEKAGFVSTNINKNKIDIRGFVIAFYPKYPTLVIANLK